jgi:hypothetical protein
MCRVLVFKCLLSANLNSSLSKSTYRLQSKDDHGNVVNSNMSSTNGNCVLQSITSNTQRNEFDNNDQRKSITSSWKQIVINKDEKKISRRN